MSDQIIFENACASLRYHPVERVIHHEMKQRAQGNEFRELLDAGYKHLIKYKATKWLSDDRKFSTLDEGDEKWAKGEWFPKMAKAGWLYWAIVNPQKAVGQLSMKRNVTFMQMGGVTVGTFATPEEALAWLKQVDLKKAG